MGDSLLDQEDFSVSAADIADAATGPSLFAQNEEDEEGTIPQIPQTIDSLPEAAPYVPPKRQPTSESMNTAAFQAWEVKQQELIAEREEREAAMVSERKLAAEKELKEWFEARASRIAANKVRNRDADAALHKESTDMEGLSETEPSKKETSWARVYELVDSAAKASKVKNVDSKQGRAQDAQNSKYQRLFCFLNGTGLDTAITAHKVGGSLPERRKSNEDSKDRRFRS